MTPGLSGDLRCWDFLQETQAIWKNQPTRKSAQIFPEFCQKSWNYFHEHNLRRAFRLPCLQKRLKKFSREQSNVSTGQPYDDALPDWRCIKCISNARMQLFFVKLVLKLNWGQKNAVKPKSKNKKQTIWVLIGENNTGPSSFILYWWFQFLPYVIVNTILSNKLMKRLEHVAMECYHFSCC